MVLLQSPVLARYTQTIQNKQGEKILHTLRPLYKHLVKSIYTDAKVSCMH